MTTSITRVADRYMIRQAARQASSEIKQIKQASLSKAARKVQVEFTAPVLEAFAFGFRTRVALLGIRSVVKKVKQIWQAFKTAPKKWEEFKSNLGVKATNVLGLMKELPKKIMAMFKKGMGLLQKAGKAIYKQFPFIEIYFKVAPKLPSVQSYLAELANKYLPAPIKKGLAAVGAGAMSFATFLDAKIGKSSVLKGLAWPAKAVAFYMIWINVAELSWNVPEIIRGMMGLISFSELFSSLPESGLGLIVQLLFGSLIPGGAIIGKIGWNAILPMALAVQIYWLWKRGYIQYAAKKIVILWDKLKIDPATVQMSSALTL